MTLPLATLPGSPHLIPRIENICNIKTSTRLVNLGVNQITFLGGGDYQWAIISEGSLALSEGPLMIRPE